MREVIGCHQYQLAMFLRLASPFAMRISFGPTTRDSPSVEEFRRTNRFKLVKFAIYLVAVQATFLILFLRFGAYSIRADASLAENGISAALGGGAGRNENGHLQKTWTMQVTSWLRDTYEIEQRMY